MNVACGLINKRNRTKRALAGATTLLALGMVQTANSNIVTFANVNSITINDGPNPPTKAFPYPSSITVSGLTGFVVGHLSVTLNGFSHDNPDNVDMLLVGPGGQNLVLMSDAGGTINAINLTITFDDAAPSPVPDNGPLLSTTYRPANYNGTGTDTYPAPAPTPSASTTLAAFNNTNPNGVWSLYIVDDNDKAAGAISGGWSLTIDAVINDNCANAFQIVDGNTPFNNMGATTDGPDLPANCDQGSGTGFGSDIWYSYTPHCDGTLIVSTCNQANFDTRLAAYTGDCSNLQLIGCNDDGQKCNSFTSLMNVQVFTAQPVLLRVGGFASAQNPGGFQGSGTLSVSLLAESAPFNGWALAFDGVDDFVSVANSAGLDLVQSFTIEAWVKSNTLSGDHVIVAKRTSDNRGYVLRITGGRLAFFAAGVQDFMTTNPVINAGQWTHVAVVYDNTNTALFYVNGSLAQSVPGVGPVQVGTATFTVGKQLINTNFWSGAIDELRVWNIQRTQAQIQATLHTLLTGGEAGLTAYWRFDEGFGTLAADLTGGNNNPGILNGPTWFPTSICSSPCRADIAPPSGNGTVNVDDLLAIINAWGPCPPGPCLADIAPAPTGNGVVNVDDLLLVINSWGPCP